MLDQQPAFIVGVTGHWDLTPEDAEALRNRVRYIFRMLRHGARNEQGAFTDDAIELLKVFYQLDLSACDHKEKVTAVYEAFLNDWPGLGATPIIVLSSLAPGADQLVAEVALEKEFQELNFHLVAPTPFPVPQFEPEAAQIGVSYRDSSTFVRKGLSSEAVVQLQNEFESIVNRMPQADGLPRGFTVTLEDDLKFKTRSEWLEQCKTDLSDQSRRRLRYQAAGEYIAAYSHLMLAIWDHIDDSAKTAGTAAIVNVRQTGLTPGLLPVASRLPLPLGPTLQLLTRRASRDEQTIKTSPSQSSLPNSCGNSYLSEETISEPSWTIRWLFPAIDRAEIRELQPYGAPCSLRIDRLQHGLRSLSETAVHLRKFVVRKLVEPDKALTHLETFLSYSSTMSAQKADVIALDELKNSSTNLFHKIKRIADFRRRATNEQRIENGWAEANIRTLFLFTLAAALLIDAFNHWHTQNEPHIATHKAEAIAEGEAEKLPSDNQPMAETNKDPKSSAMSTDGKTSTEKPTDRNTTDVEYEGIEKESIRTANAANVAGDPHRDPHRDPHTNSHPPEPWGAGFLARLARILLGGFGLYFVFKALLLFSKVRPQQHEENNHDLRAIAEGARVQMLWFMAGVGRSVSANYMLRQRGEFSWIRQVIRSMAFPYETVQWQFRELPRASQLKLLRSVFHNWLRGHSTNAQCNYFQRARNEQIHAIHFWHKLGSILVLAGLLLAVLQVTAALVDVLFQSHSLEVFAGELWSFWICWLLLFPAAVGGYVLLRKRRDQQWSPIKWLEHGLERCVCTQDPTAFTSSETRFRRQIGKNFLIYLWYAFATATTVFLLAVLLSRCSYLPGVGNVTTILSAVLLVCGGLSIAWPEKNLNSEIAFQYGTMHQMFQLAANLMEVQLQQLATLETIASNRNSAEALVRSQAFTGPDDELTARIDAAQAQAFSDFDALVTKIQEALFELGQEALDENAEWLILHRARPLEPVMAG